MHDQNGTGLGGITFQLYRYNASTELYEQVDGTSTSAGTSAALGSYRFTPLESGDYRLQFSHPQGAYLAEYYDDKADLESAVTISLAEGEHLAGIDAVVMTPDYASWADGYSLLGNDRLGHRDPDGEGFNNNKEYAFGTSPTVPYAVQLKITGTPPGYTLSWLERNTPATYSVVSTTNLAATPFAADPDAVIDVSSDQSGVPSSYTRKESIFGYSPALRAKISSVKANMHTAPH